MNGVLREMKKKKYEIPADVISVFEGITEEAYFNPEWDDEFCLAMNERLTKEQRFRLYETQGGCNGTGADKDRKAFAAENANLALDERIALFAKTFGRWKPELNDDNTLTLRFKCHHGYYKRANEGKYTAAPENVESYFERCAGGRLYELQMALGIKLKIKSVDVSSLKENISAPVIFTFEIVG